MKKSEDLVIAIDGHSSAGKSSFAKSIADKLGVTYVDSGAMYRAVALYALEYGLIIDNIIREQELIGRLDQINIEFRFSRENEQYETWMNGNKIEHEIRGVEVSKWASTVSAIPEVRTAMVDLQRKISENRGVVMDGRAIGTVVFPDADIKIFLTSEAGVRAERRYNEMRNKGLPASYEEVLENIMLRDHQDSTRETSPLTRAEDAIQLDNSDMTIAEQMEWFGKLLKSKGKELQ